MTIGIAAILFWIVSLVFYLAPIPNQRKNTKTAYTSPSHPWKGGRVT